MKHVAAAVAAVIAVFSAAFIGMPCALAQSSNTVSARAPGFTAMAETRSPGLSQAPVISAVFPNNGWLSRTPMPGGRWGHAMASYSAGAYPTNAAYVYVISGSDASFATVGTVSRYDVTLDSWSNVASMTPARSQIGAARIGGKIYVPGGYAGSFSPTNTLSVYDIATDVWTTGAALPQATGDYAIGVYADRYVFVIGGYSGSADLNTVQIYDSTNNTWQLGTSKTGTAVAGLRGGIVGNRIVVAGGYSQTLATEVADAVVGTIDPVTPTSIAWTAAAAYPGGPAGRFGAGAPFAAGPAQGVSALNVVLFTAGDPNGQGISVKNDTWLYDFNTDTWKSGPVKPTGVSNIGNMAGVASGGKLSMVSTGGYNGSVVVSVNEWLEFGYEEPSDVALTMSGGGVPIHALDTVVYTLNYTVTGPGSAPATTISDTIPAGTAFNAAASSPGWACMPDASAGSTCVASLGNLPDASAGSINLALDSITSPLPPGTVQIVNTATISTVGAFAQEQNLANNQASVTTLYALPTTLAVVGGSPQSATTGTAFATPLGVHVADANGNPYSGVVVDFAAAAGGASAALSSSSAITDSNGDASVSATANTTAGAYTINASVADYSGITPVSFALSNTAGAAAALSIIGGSPQSTPIGTAFTVPLGVQVRDLFNNPTAGVDVAFAVPGSGASALLSTTSATTDANGIATITAMANEVVGAYTVSANVAGVTSTGTFALTNLMPDVALSASIDDHRDFAQYAHTLDYIVTIRNAGTSDARHVIVSSALSAQIDVAYADWSCLGSGTCVASGSGELSDTDVTIPAHGSVAWILSAPTLPDPSDATVVTTVSATSPDQIDVAAASDTTTLVIFRDGFDLAYAGGADNVPFELLAAPLRSGSGMKVPLPPITSGQAVDTVLNARSAGASGFRLDRLTHADATWLRLIAVDAVQHEQATAWIRIDKGADVVLRLAASDTFGSVVLVNGAQSARLDLGNVGADPTYAVSVAPAGIVVQH